MQSGRSSWRLALYEDRRINSQTACLFWRLDNKFLEKRPQENPHLTAKFPFASRNILHTIVLGKGIIGPHIVTKSNSGNKPRSLLTILLLFSLTCLFSKVLVHNSW